MLTVKYIVGLAGLEYYDEEGTDPDCICDYRVYDDFNEALKAYKATCKFFINKKYTDKCPFKDYKLDAHYNCTLSLNIDCEVSLIELDSKLVY